LATQGDVGDDIRVDIPVLKLEAVLFKSKSRLEAENAAVPAARCWRSFGV
jgi:hypothetical protein